MFLMNAAVLVAIFSYCRCTDINCHNIFRETPFGELECIQDSGEYDDDSSCDEIDTTNITVKVINFTVGALSVEFNLLPRNCKYERYDLDLRVYEHVTTKEECERLTYSATRAVHSKRFLKIQDQEISSESSLPLCERTGTVSFNYVYTGCYELRIEATADYRMFENVSVPIFLETGYKKELIIHKKPVITRQYRPSQQQIDIGIQLKTYGDFQDLQMNFQLMSGIDPSKDDPCYVSGYEHSCCAYRTSGDFMCRVIQNDDKAVCSISHDEIIWTVQNVTPGNYCVLVELIDDRCEKYTVWNNKSFCRYNSPIIEVPETSTTSSEGVPQSPDSTPIYVILLSIFVVLVALCLCILIYFWRRRGPRAQPGRVSSLKKCPLSTRPRIVLLYSRDCKAFMNLMTTFRDMLKIVTKCEVLDGFDPAVVEEVSRNKVDWLTRHLTCPDVKIVVVESKCAVLHEKALVRHSKLFYRDLCTSEDDLFLYGLRLLREDLKQNTYDRIFVVRIHGFTEPEDNLSHLAPYTRYIIPQHTEKLLNSLYQYKTCPFDSRIPTYTTKQLTQKTSEYVLIIAENTDSIFQKLNEDMRTLESYKQQNQDYLSKLLEIT